MEEDADIIAQHLRASDELHDVIPGGKMITILRSIPSLYESTFGYMDKQCRIVLTKNCFSKYLVLTPTLAVGLREDNSP